MPVSIFPLAVRFSNRPFGVKRFQTIHQHRIDVAWRVHACLRNQHHGSSIMGFEGRWNNLKNGLAVRGREARGARSHDSGGAQPQRDNDL